MYKSKLENSYEIADYIQEQSVGEVDYDLIEENYKGYSAILKEVLVADLEEGEDTVNVAIKSKQKKYDKMSPETSPPIVVDGNKVIDGSHRLRSFRKRGIKHIMAYVLE